MSERYKPEGTPLKTPVKTPVKTSVSQDALSNETDPAAKIQELLRNYSGDGLLYGVILSEVLGKPKCFRRGRPYSSL